MGDKHRTYLSRLSISPSSESRILWANSAASERIRLRYVKWRTTAAIHRSASIAMNQIGVHSLNGSIGLKPNSYPRLVSVKLPAASLELYFLISPSFLFRFCVLSYLYLVTTWPISKMMMVAKVGMVLIAARYARTMKRSCTTARHVGV